MNASFEYIKKYAAMLAGAETGARLFLETEEGVLATKKGADLANLAENDIERISGAIFLGDKRGREGKSEESHRLRAAVISKTPACQMWLSRGEELIPSLDDMAQIIGTRAEVIDGSEGFEKVADRLARALRTNAGCFVTTGRDANGAYLGYTLTVGRTPYEAIVAMTVLEKSAEVSLLAENLGGACQIAPWERKLMRFVYMKKYSKAEEKAKLEENREAAAGKEEVGGKREAAAEKTKAAETPETGEIANAAETPETGEIAGSAKITESGEEGLREMLVEYGKMLVASGLVQGTWGNLSVRLDGEHMLVTPSGLDYMRLAPADMVKVKIKTLEYEGDLKPTSEKGLHAAIYRNRPDVRAIIHTHSKYCSVFAAAHKDLPVPEQENPAAHKDLPVPEQENPAAHKDLPVPEQENPAAHKDLPVPEQENPAAHKDLPVPEQENPAAHKDLPVPEQENPAAHKDLAAPFSNPVKLAAYALPGTKALMKNTAAAVGKNNGAIMANHGMIVCGEDIEAAFKNARALEALARENGRVKQNDKKCEF